jgi:hypothetical protein
MREPVSDEVKAMQASLLNTALNWSGDHPEFNDDFIVSLNESFKKYGSLTPKQHAALGNIVDKFRMGEES